MNVIQVTCGLILKDGKVLVAQRSKTMSLPLKWEFPGGKIIRGESEEDCLKRELREELNISINIRERLNTSIFNYGDYTVALIPFVVDYIEGDVVLYEHCQMGWFTRGELKDLDWALADIPILEEFLNRSFI
jgi:8-oxo-dGTP diphosphatase